MTHDAVITRHPTCIKYLIIFIKYTQIFINFFKTQQDSDCLQLNTSSLDEQI